MADSASRFQDPTLVGTRIRAQTANTIPADLPLERDFGEGTDYTITDHVRELHAKLTAPQSPRLALVMDRLVYHLHAFAREVGLTHAEWAAAVELIGRAGKESTAGKDEVVLMSDCLGLSVLVDEMEHPRPKAATEGCEEGPFYTKSFPEVPSGSCISHPDTVGQPLFFEATVKNTKGEPIQGAKAEVWQSDGEGTYDVMYDTPPESGADDRARIIAEPNGYFSYRGVLPVAYPIPDDGPCGTMLRALGRHPHRASHLHFRLTAPGYDSLTTALYPSHSPFLGTDPVFATRLSLIGDLEQAEDVGKWKEWGFDEADVRKRGGKVWAWRFAFVLASKEEVELERQNRKADRITPNTKL
ncbi:aromatic compound dioxygenase [Vararia minispora EC-137]|uniref:Aromatic compound dioxygenase n=1 Tax=Vararia minispora EC-137 TaxID=1314806 RepID=A0ACB8QIK9_9AGAM|nr:aromatic compound dioxygenase [Vararia minispora EC-137]